MALMCANLSGEKECLRNDEEKLIKRYRLDRAGIIFVSNLVKGRHITTNFTQQCIFMEIECCDNAPFPCHNVFS